MIERAESRALTEGMAWVRRANARPIGVVEFRHVRMRIGSGLLARKLEIRTLRRIVGDQAQSVYCLMAPRLLANTNFRLREARGRVNPFDIELYLPFGRTSVRELAPERRRESLLGSDFAYDDLRIWLYEEDHAYRLAEDTTDEVVLRGRCVAGTCASRTGSATFDVTIDRENDVVRSIDVRSDTDDPIVRSYSAEDVSNVDGVLVPGVMRMRDLTRGHETVIELQRAWYDHEIDPSIFETSSRPRTRSYLAEL